MEPESVCIIDVIPKSWIHVQTVWNDSVNDQDLHVVWWSNPAHNRDMFDVNDCYYANPLPHWFGTFPEDPRLDIDDTYGYGPENFNIDRPTPGTYRVYMNYAGNHYDYYTTPWTTDTVRIYLRGQLAAQYSRSLHYDFAQIWAIADIVWQDDDNYFVRPLPSDNPSDPLNVGYLCDVYYDYWDDWWATTCPTSP
ncbi:MAG: hypothetical protein V2A79_04425 [Planctomycetota bacterium]